VTAAALVLAPLACSTVLALSGVVKARDVPATREAFAALSVPSPLRSEWVVRSLPFIEIGLAFLLLVTWGGPLAVTAAAASVLFAFYWVLVLLVLRRDEVVDCGCFGALGDDRVTGTTLLRNVMLTVVAGLACAFGASGSGVWPTIQDMTGEEAAWLGMALASVAVALLVVGRRHEPSLAVGEDVLDYDRRVIPFALLTDKNGNNATLRELARERPQLMVFLSDYCYSCVEIANRLLAWQAQLGPVEIQTVFTAPLSSLPENVTPPGIRVWFDVEHGATDTFAAYGRPAAVLLGADGLLAGGPVSGTGKVSEFVEDILAELAAADSAPDDADGPNTMRVYVPEAEILGGHDHQH
jgi:hypothetical protein